MPLGNLLLFLFIVKGPTFPFPALKFKSQENRKQKPQCMPGQAGRQSDRTGVGANARAKDRLQLK